MFRTSYKKVFFILWMICLAGCSSSSTTTTAADPAVAASSDLTIFTKWAGHAWKDVAAATQDSSDKDIDTSLLSPCTGGGTIEESGSTITLSGCIETDGGTTYMTSGTDTITFTIPGSLTTHNWDQTVIVDSDTTFTSTGSISFDTVNDLISFDYTGTFDSIKFRLTGIVSDNPDDTSDVAYSVLWNEGDRDTADVAWKDGSFDDTDLDTLTDSEVDQAYTDDNDSACSTLECANDFQCQIFADDDPTDAYTTGNTQCTAGCCALVEETVGCAANTISCTTDFQCQMFADDDLTDEFTTSNVECSSGCCAVIGG